MFKSVSKLTRSKKGVGITIGIWLLLAIVLSVVAPTAKEEVSKQEGSGLPEDSLTEQAARVTDQYFSKDKGTPAILVFTSEKALSDKEISSIANTSKNIEELNNKNIKEV